ncbi:hypothetical protein IU450_09025 [Nocardia abscessus]|uniref:hypothetical protein n=1 Tax=Nocardia abscessus TaxID=120957 RepID=UPI00189509BE|nr:hypothetical protein [Nocardia abscessus]MBF6336027.1 hypothetical protein [Nocardia abscessus]
MNEDMRAHVMAVVDKAPLMTPQLRERITALLRTGRPTTIGDTPAQGQGETWQAAA